MKKHQKVRREDDALVIQKRNSFRRNSSPWRKALTWAVTAWTLGMAPTAYANPVLDSKDAAVAITGLGTSNVAISSSETNNLIKWVDFSIASGEKVAFDANNYLNYVTGHAVSDIQGTLTGGGHIYLVNPNGILIGDGAVINVGHLHLSTRALTDDVMNSFVPDGTHTLTGAIGGDVINLGQLNANTITVEGNNITFKNTADVTKGGSLGADGKITGGTAHNDSAVTLTAKSKGEIHIGSADASTPGYTMSGTDNKYMLMYKLISTADELQAINTDRNTRKGYYMLANDVDMKDFGNFTPIAPGDGGGYFTGRFDGLNHQIQNLTINSGADNVGLFGRVLGPGVIENVGLVGGSVTGTGTSSYVGGIVGFNDGGTIRNVYHTGTVSGTEYVGGIVGFNDYESEYLGTVERAYNTGSVVGTFSQAMVGGIAGHSKGVIREVFNTGTVSSTGSTSKVGGIVGDMYNLAASFENAYNTGAITGAYFVGGIAGSFSQGKLTNVYNTGTVTGTGKNVKAGGLVGSGGAAPENAYSKTGVAPALTGTDLTANDTNVAELSAEEMKTPAKFVGFGFTQNTDGSYTGFSENGKWRIYEGQTMPLLTAFLTRADYRGEKEYDGTADAGTFGGYSALTFDGVVDQIKKVNANYIYGYNYIQDYTVVTPKELTVSFGSRIYDGTPNVTGAGTLAGVVGNDVVTLSAATGATAAFGDKNVGTDKAVTLTGYSLTGEKAGNYTLSGGTGTITAADLKISVEDYSREYDGTTDASGATLTVVDGEIFTGDSISGGTKTFDTKEVGTGKTVTVSNVIISDGNSGNNYNVTYQPNTNSEITGSTNPNPNPDPNPNPNPNPTPKDVIEESTNNQNAAKEYTNVVASLDSGANTVLPTTNALPTESVMTTNSVMPTNSVLPTGNNAPTGNPQPTEASQENNSASGEQNETQEQNGLLPTQQMDNGQIAASKQETQLGITYTDINMPESMSVEALATSLNGGATATTPNNAGGEATQNGPATEPTATTGGNMSGASEEDEA